MGEGLAEKLEELVHPVTVRDVCGALRHHRIADRPRRRKSIWYLADAIGIAVRGHPHESAVMCPAIVGVVVVAIVVMTVRISRGDELEIVIFHGIKQKLDLHRNTPDPHSLRTDKILKSKNTTTTKLPHG
jgi:hypothetical protein